GGARIPATQGTLDRGQHLITMQGGDVFKLAVKSMADAAEESLAEAGLGLDDIALMVPHQANIRIIEQVAKRLHFPMEKVFVNIQRYGNTSAASIPIAICEAEATGRLRRGDKVLLVAFGGGFTWGAAVLEWFGAHDGMRPPSPLERAAQVLDRKSTRLNSSHVSISYAVFCLKKKKKKNNNYNLYKSMRRFSAMP